MLVRLSIDKCSDLLLTNFYNIKKSVVNYIHGINKKMKKSIFLALTLLSCSTVFAQMTPSDLSSESQLTTPPEISGVIDITGPASPACLCDCKSVYSGNNNLSTNKVAPADTTFIVRPVPSSNDCKQLNDEKCFGYPVDPRSGKLTGQAGQGGKLANCGYVRAAPEKSTEITVISELP